MKRLALIPHWQILMFIALFLRLLNLGSERLWFDEAFTFWTSRPTTDFWRAVLGDNHPPLWPIIQRLNVELFGFSEFTFRLPAALLGVGCVLLVWLIAVNIPLPRKTALVIGLVACVMPGLIYYSQDARMYSLMAFCVLLATLAARRGQAWLFVLAGIGAVYTQNVGVIYIGLLGAARIWYIVRYWGYANQRGKWIGKWFISLGIIGLAWLPWAGVVIGQARQMGQNFWLLPINPVNVFWPMLLDTFSWRIPDVFQMWIYGLAIGLTVIGLIVSRRRITYAARTVIISGIVIAPLALAIFSTFVVNAYVHRALLPSAYLLMIPWGIALCHLSRDNRRIAWALTAPALAIALFSYYVPVALPEQYRDDVEAWIQPVLDQWQDGDILYYPNATDAAVYQVYNNRVFALPEQKGDLVRLTDEARAAFGWNFASLNELKARGYRRIWAVWGKTPFAQVDELAQGEQVQREGKLIAHHEDKLIESGIYLIEVRQ